MRAAIYSNNMERLYGTVCCDGGTISFDPYHGGDGPETNLSHLKHSVALTMKPGESPQEIIQNLPNRIRDRCTILPEGFEPDPGFFDITPPDVYDDTPQEPQAETTPVVQQTTIFHQETTIVETPPTSTPGRTRAKFSLNKTILKPFQSRKRKPR